jgi:hypothetical protein
VACRIVLEIDQINGRRTAEHQAGRGPTPLALLPPLEHLWVVCDSADPLVRERMRDLLNRRRQFEALDDYVRLHPHVNPAIFQVQTDPVSSDRPGWIMGGVVKVSHSLCFLSFRRDVKETNYILRAQAEDCTPLPARLRLGRET